MDKKNEDYNHATRKYILLMSLRSIRTIFLYVMPSSVPNAIWIFSRCCCVDSNGPGTSATHYIAVYNIANIYTIYIILLLFYLISYYLSLLQVILFLVSLWLFCGFGFCLSFLCSFEDFVFKVRFLDCKNLLLLLSPGNSFSTRPEWAYVVASK